MPAWATGKLSATGHRPRHRPVSAANGRDRRPGEQRTDRRSGYEDRGNRRHRPDRVQGRVGSHRGRALGGGRGAQHRRQHPDRRGAGRRGRGHRRVELALLRRQRGVPLNGMTEVAGPERFRMDEFFMDALALRGDPARWSPTRTPGTSAPSWASGRCCRVTTRPSARSASPAGPAGTGPAGNGAAAPHRHSPTSHLEDR